MVNYDGKLRWTVVPQSRSIFWLVCDGSGNEQTVWTTFDYVNSSHQAGSCESENHYNIQVLTFTHERRPSPSHDHIGSQLFLTTNQHNGSMCDQGCGARKLRSIRDVFLATSVTSFWFWGCGWPLAGPSMSRSAIQASSALDREFQQQSVQVDLPDLGHLCLLQRFNPHPLPLPAVFSCVLSVAANARGATNRD